MENELKIHLGRMVHDQLKQQGKTTVWLAAQLGYTRESVYKIYRRSWMTTDLLIRISVILNYDFFAQVSEMLNKNQCVAK
jgi:plasmid maintenance system antidote protein VapI